MVSKLCDLTIKEAASAIAAGKSTVLELVESCLERIHDMEGKIQAWALVDGEGPLKAAQRLDQKHDHVLAGRRQRHDARGQLRRDRQDRPVRTRCKKRRSR